MKRIVLLDTSAIMYRAFFANMHFRTKKEPTGAVYGFANTLLSIMKEFTPDYMVAAFDVKRASLKRTQLYSNYKAQRDAVPEDLLTQIPRIEELLDCYDIKKIKVDGCEADDVLGTIATKISKNETEAIIVTGDKDLAQVLGPNIKVALLGKGDGDHGFKIIESQEDVIGYLGVRSDKIPDLFGLIGDTSDGIPGIRKIGPKKAIPMLERFNNIEGIYDNIDKLSDIPGVGRSLIENIKEDKDLAFLSRSLATIDKNIDIDCTPSNFTYAMNKNKLYDLFKELEFKALIKKLELEDNTSENSKIELPLEQNKAENTLAKKDISTFNLITTNEQYKDLLDGLDKKDLLSVIFSSAGIAMSFSDKDVYVPLHHNALLYKNFDEHMLYSFLEREDLDITTYNAKILLNNNIKIKHIVMDTMIGCHLITSQTKDDTDIPISKFSDMELDDYKDVFGKEDPCNLDPDKYGRFLAKRSRGTLLITPIIQNELNSSSLSKVWEETELPLIKVLSSMERSGIKIDPTYFKNYSKELDNAIIENQKKIFEIAGGEFNLNSPKQLSEVLFMKLNLMPIKKTKTGLSTNVDVLESLQDNGVEIAAYLLEYRKLIKLKSTYVDTLPNLTDSQMRIHTTFNQIGTSTGRLSSSDPNLQNIPVRSNEGIKIREGFVAKNGYLLLGSDYSQIELRVLAEISGDTNLIKAYQNNEDLHTRTARRLFASNDTDPITRTQRAMAKVINFSIIYGKTPFGLSKELKITPKEAGDYINKYFEEYPKVRDLENNIISFAEKTGYTETYFKRRRLIDGINSKNKNIKSQAERMAVNSVIQGSAAEIIKKAMIQIYDMIKDKDDIAMLLQVHDELIFEIKEDKIDTYRPIIENIMRHCVKFDNVPLEVNTNIGNNWAKLK